MSPGRNDPCPCGSGRKFKHCCGRPIAPAAAAATADPREIGALVGMVHAGRLQEAQARADALLRVQPEQGMLWKILSVALLRQGKDALPALRRAAEFLPRDAEAHANLGSELRVRGTWEAALASLRRSLELEPRNPDALIEAADVERALGRERDAVSLYERALQLDPLRGEAHNNLGNALLELAQPEAAVRCYRQALAIKPDDAQVLCNLGNALRQVGELEEALDCSRRAIALAPRLAMAHNNLGLLLTGRGQRAEAVTSFREALRLNPRYVEALNNLGNVLREQGEQREALELYRQALQFDAARADSHCNLGYALLDARRVADAAASFRSALALQPNNVSAQLGLVAARRVQGLTTEAEARCRVALAAEPRSSAALSLLGELCADRGRFDEAQELFERAIALDADFVPAYGSIAAHRRMSRKDSAWLEGAERLLARPLPLAEQIHLRYALGKFFDDVGECHKAFLSYQAANELTKRYGARYERARFTGVVDRIISVCDEAFVREPRPGVCESERPVFIIGMPRSGTSLTEQILASHPQVFGAGEVSFWEQGFTTLERGADSGGATAALAGVARDYLARIGAQAGAASRVTDKMPANFLYAGLIHAALPRARIIHMQRHPLDTCLSIYFQNFFNVSPYANDLGNLAHYYGEYRRVMAHWRRTLPPSALLEAPYEGLVEDAEGWTRRMLEFIGLPWDPKCLDFHRSDRVVITASKWQVRQQINASSVGRWRNYEQYLAPLQHLAGLEVVTQAMRVASGRPSSGV
ncbi:MAG TPA: tetratricopeptide repeat protein [Steroidobacteraceae bacterium]|nr:tetratricopeptide repeat protein [Steroidobacteraceae bacterium]